jgi:dihydroorotate dehydrogenase
VDTSLGLAVDGIIATNTTIARSGSITSKSAQFGSGGLSGRPLAARSTEVVTQIYRASKGKLPIIGVGGIFTAEDAFDKIAAGASLVEAYTGFVYSGPRFARDVVRGLAVMLKDRGFGSLDEAVGSAVR